MYYLTAHLRKEQGTVTSEGTQLEMKPLLKNLVLAYYSHQPHNVMIGSEWQPRLQCQHLGGLGGMSSSRPAQAT